jgi:hypothetical protein
MSSVGENDSHRSAGSSASVDDDDSHPLPVGSPTLVAPSAVSPYGGVFMGSEFYSGAFTNFPTSSNVVGHGPRDFFLNNGGDVAAGGNEAASAPPGTGTRTSNPHSPWSAKLRPSNPGLLSFPSTVPVPRNG